LRHRRVLRNSVAWSLPILKGPTSSLLDQHADRKPSLTHAQIRRAAKLHIVADAFEQELLTDIAEAEAIGENELAAEWRLELNTYRAAEKQAILEEQGWGGSPAVVRREALGRRRSDLP
jgi:hypothetical protein